MALANPQPAYQGAGLGETQLASVSVQRPRASIYFEQGSSSSKLGFSPPGLTVSSDCVWGCRLGEEASVVTRGEFGSLNQRLSVLCSG